MRRLRWPAAGQAVLHGGARRGDRWLAGAVGLLGVGLAGWFAARHSLSRPFFVDEAWRAYLTSRGRDFTAALRSTPSPQTAGFLLVGKLAVLLAGNRESVLRLTVLPALPLTGVACYRLNRRVAGPVASAVVAAALSVQTGVLVYATMYKEYVGELLATAVALTLFPLAADRSRRLPVRLAAAAVIGLLPVYSLPGLFVSLLLAVGLLGRLALSVRRGRRPVGAELAVIGLLSVPGLLHALVVLRGEATTLPRNLLGYWAGFFPPGLSRLPGWFWAQLHPWLPGVVTNGFPAAPDVAEPHLLRIQGPLAAVTLVALLVTLGGAVLAGRRSGFVRLLGAVLVGGLAVTFGLAALHRWPFGFVRVNLFLLPVGYALLAAGLTELAGRWRPTGAAAPRRSPGGRRFRPVAGLVVVAGWSWLAAAGAVGVRNADVVAVDLAFRQDGMGLRAVAAELRAGWRPGDLLVAEVDATPLRYYLADYQGYPGRPTRVAVPDRRVAGFGDFAPAGLPGVVAVARPPRLWLFQAPGIDRTGYLRSLRLLAGFGYRSVLVRSYPRGGLVTLLVTDPAGTSR